MLKKTARQLVDEAMAVVTTLDADDARRLHGAPDLLFVDLREADERARDGTIPGSVHAPRGVLEFWVDPGSPFHRPVFADGRALLLFCAGGGRSALAAQALQAMGLPRVSHLGGGFAAWRERGGAVEAAGD